MLVLCCKAPNIHLVFSHGNFVKHLPVSKLRTFRHAVTNTKTFTTAGAGLNSSCFEALTSRQNEQINLYVDALLQWNQVFLSIFLTLLIPSFFFFDWHLILFLCISVAILCAYINICIRYVFVCFVGKT